MWESAPWPVVDNFRRAFLLATRRRQLFVSPQVGTVISRRRGAARRLIGCDARHTSKILWDESVYVCIQRTQQTQPPPKPSGVFFVAHRSKLKKTMAGNFENEVTSDRSRIRMNKKHEVRYWTEALGCSEDELAAAVARRHWAYGTFPRDALKPRRRGRPRKRA